MNGMLSLGVGMTKQNVKYLKLKKQRIKNVMVLLSLWRIFYGGRLSLMLRLLH
jgi:hypothetical protein